MENKLQSKRNELDEVNVQLQEEKRSNEKINNLTKRNDKERCKTKENHRAVPQDNLQLEKDLEESQSEKDK